MIEAKLSTVTTTRQTLLLLLVSCVSWNTELGELLGGLNGISETDAGLAFPWWHQRAVNIVKDLLR